MAVISIHLVVLYGVEQHLTVRNTPRLGTVGLLVPRAENLGTIPPVPMVVVSVYITYLCWNCYKSKSV